MKITIDVNEISSEIVQCGVLPKDLKEWDLDIVTDGHVMDVLSIKYDLRQLILNSLTENCEALNLKNPNK